MSGIQKVVRGSMSIEEAREILGVDAVALSDDVIREDIETATFFKDIFFSMLWDKRRRKASDPDE